MSKRKTRRVTIELSARNPADPKALFKAVEQAFRPDEVHVVARGSDKDERFAPERILVNEHRDTNVRKEVGKTLDKKNDQIVAAQGKRAVSSSATEVASPAEIQEKLSRIRRYRATLWRIGWWVMARCAEVKELLGS